MDRPVARLWAGALVMGVATILEAGPVRLDQPWVESLDPPRVAPAEVAPARTEPTAVALAFEPVDFSPPQSLRSLNGGSPARAAVAPTQTTLAIPLPPAVLPAGVVLAGIAIYGLLRKHRRT